MSTICREAALQRVRRFRRFTRRRDAALTVEEVARLSFVHWSLVMLGTFDEWSC